MGFTRFLRRANWDRERREEIESYVQIETDENIARGMPPEEARAAARRRFGNSTRVREEIYRMNTIAFLDALVRDVRHALRRLRHNPTFTAVALLTIAIGIGANTAVFSVVNSVLIKPLNYPKPEELVALHQTATGAAGLTNVSDGLLLSGSMYFTYAEHNRTLESMGVYALGSVAVTGFAEPEQVSAVFVSDGVLQTLGVRPALGRWLDRGDQALTSPETVMLSYGYWQRRFGGDRSVISRTLRVESRPRQIVGVMPRGFRVVSADAELIMPVRFDRGKLSLPGFGLRGVARLKPGVTIAQANADLARLLPVWMDSWPFPYGNPHLYENWRITPDLRPLQRQVVGNVAGMLWVVMATIGVVLLIACANVANLLLVRAEARQRELAIRAALGAGRGQVIWELLLESVLLGLLGGALGVCFAYEGLHFLVAIGPGNLPRLDEISLDGRALVFALIVSVLSGLLFGLIPALKYAGRRISTTLRSAGRTSSLSRERHRARNVLVITQVAMALVLMVSAGLMIRTFQALTTVEPGFTHPEQLQTLQVSISGALVAEPQQVTRIQNEILDKLEAFPGVTSAAFVDLMPMEGIEGDWNIIMPEGKLSSPEELPLRMYRSVSPGYLHTMGTKLVAGRELTWTDVYGFRRNAMVSENLARELWGTPAGALGKRFHVLPKTPWWEVVGVVQDVRENGVDQKAPAIVYWPPMKENLYGPGPLDAVRSVTFAIRTERAGTESFVNQVRQAVWSANSSLPVAEVRTMSDIYDQSLAPVSFTLVMLGIAGAMALLLGIVGIYGVIAYAVSQRRREIGIRLALGAQQGDLRRMFLRYGLTLAGIGVMIGLGTASGLTRLMKSLLFGISPLDPLTYAVVPLVLILAVLLASYLPARRAAAVDPVETLKAE